MMIMNDDDTNDVLQVITTSTSKDAVHPQKNIPGEGRGESGEKQGRTR
jgi:hypothetical protein